MSLNTPSTGTTDRLSKRRVRVVITVLLLAAFGIASIWAAERRRSGPARVERGDYLVTVLGCHDCHTPWVVGPNGPEPDMTRMLSGHPEDLDMPAPPPADMLWAWSGAATNTAYAGPWGVSYAFNLTPDINTGIGIWTEDIFKATLRNGRHWGVARPILPPMPWQNFRYLTDEDLEAVWAFLRSIPPVSNRVPEAIVADAGDQ